MSWASCRARPLAFEGVADYAIALEHEGPDLSEQRSALDSWRRMSEEPSVQPTIARHMPLILSVAAAIGIAPFAVMRWMAADWPLAIIDTILVTGFIALGTYIYRTRKVRAASLLIAALCVIGTLTTVQLRGPQQVYWAYPALMTCFYLLRPREAISLTLTMTAALVVQLIDVGDPLRVGSIIATILVTTAFAFAFSVLNNRQQDQLLELATRDPLTGVGNRRAFLSKLAEIEPKFERTQIPSSLVLLDVDHFKRINDVHGHRAGDEILKRIAHRVESRVRLTDSLYRIGGEEFVVVIDGEGIGTATLLAEELRERIEASELMPGIALTVSIGVAEIRSQESHEAWLHRADEALYTAKRSGRNRVRVAA
jgi:diguanylate cyclase